MQQTPLGVDRKQSREYVHSPFAYSIVLIMNAPASPSFLHRGSHTTNQTAWKGELRWCNYFSRFPGYTERKTEGWAGERWGGFWCRTVAKQQSQFQCLLKGVKRFRITLMHDLMVHSPLVQPTRALSTKLCGSVGVCCLGSKSQGCFFSFGLFFCLIKGVWEKIQIQLLSD